jgi:hypothetical protein
MCTGFTVSSDFAPAWTSILVANISALFCICVRDATSRMEETMKQYVRAFCTLALLAGSFPSVSAQGSQPSHPVDPTAQAPATRAPATPPTFPTSEAKPRPDARVYIGTIVRDGDAYVLKAGNEKYLLDSQKKAKNYKGKDVKVTGTLEKTNNVIHVEKIEVSPSM